MSTEIKVTEDSETAEFPSTAFEIARAISDASVRSKKIGARSIVVIMLDGQGNGTTPIITAEMKRLPEMVKRLREAADAIEAWSNYATACKGKKEQA